MGGSSGDWMVATYTVAGGSSGEITAAEAVVVTVAVVTGRWPAAAVEAVVVTVATYTVVGGSSGCYSSNVHGGSGDITVLVAVIVTAAEVRTQLPYISRA